MVKTYNVGDLRKLVTESSEFKPKIGDGVESENKKNNGKAYKDAKTRANDYDGGLKADEKKPKYVKSDGNKTTLDYNPENVSKEWKDRVHAQAKGYTSTAEMNNGLAKEGDFSHNDDIYNGIKDCGKEMHQNEKDFKKTGLRASKLPEKTFDKEEMYESKEGFDMRNLIDKFRAKSLAPASVIKEEKTIKTAYFKKTKFLNEEHVLSRVPDEFKNDGQQFKMKDKTGNTYLVEWNDKGSKILAHSNPKAVNEEFDKIKYLTSYSVNDTKTGFSDRLNENDESFKAMLDKARKIIK